MEIVLYIIGTSSLFALLVGVCLSIGSKDADKYADKINEDRLK